MAMAATRTAEKIRERKLNRMRLGQAVADLHYLPSDEEIQVALVPLTEAEYVEAIEITANRPIPETIAGAGVRDRYNQAEVLVRAIREPSDHSQRMFESIEEMQTAIEVSDINFLMDAYFEMVESSSPKIDSISPEELEDVKKVLQEIDLKELSGRQWYALRRFLLSVTPTLLQDSLRGFGSMSKLTTTNEEEEFTPTV